MLEPTLRDDALRQRFDLLDTFLVEHQALWRPKPFTCLSLPWEISYPQLGQWLRKQTLEHAEGAQVQTHVIGAPAPFNQLTEQARQLSRIGQMAQRATPKAPPARFINDIPGRKLAQIQAFSASLNFQKQPTHWLDWCAGKGHLGRWLALDGQPLTCLEYDAHLVDAGQHISKRLDVNAKHLQQDVLAASCAEQLRQTHTPIALHACGDLHVRLLQLATTQACTQLAIAPCCYNRIHNSHYQPLSHAAKASQLRLSRDDLSLPLNEAVTAAPRVRRQRDQSMAWRLAFDHLQRDLRGVDEYLPTPSLERAWFDKPFAEFCQDLATLRHLPRPSSCDWPALEQHGWQRLAQVRNLELVRQLFRRPLELWLVLDRALYLQEQGFSCELGIFCPYSLSPRNLLLVAER